MVAGEIPTKVQVIVIGGGPGGYAAAARAAALGKDVVLIEQGALGGVCLNVGCIPSKALITVGHDLQRAKRRFGASANALALDWPGVQAWKDSVVAQLVGGVRQTLSKVRIVQGTGRLLDGNRIAVETPDHAEHFTFEHCILATGSRPVVLENFPIDGTRIVDSTGALALAQVPQFLAVIGGGYIGMELGMAYATLGSRVTVVEAADAVLAGFDAELVKPVVARCAELGITIVTGAAAKALDGDDLVLADGTRHRADVVLVAVGRRPNTDDLQLEDAGLRTRADGLLDIDDQCRTANRSVFAIGDITPGPALAHKATAQAIVAAEAICGLPSGFDQVVPLVAFTDPELAAVGLTEAEAKAAGHSVVVGRSRFAHSGRALTLEEPAGLVKVVADAASGIVLGVHIAGAGASDLISEAALAVETAARVEDIAATIHPHPTLAESIGEAAQAAARARTRRSTTK